MDHSRLIDKDTVLCISLAARPSNHGTRFHNYLYNELGLDFVYKAFTTEDLDAAIGGLRGLGIRGCAVSMPYKERVIALVDALHDSASAIESVNTIVNDNGRLHAYNTDYLAVAALLDGVSPELDVAVAGSGGMAKAVVAALRDSGFRAGTVVARNEATGRALAERYGFQWRADTTRTEATVLINATPLGMAGGPDANATAFPENAIRTADVVFDVVATPVETPLLRTARELGKQVITGAQVIALQAAEQFELYTGIRPTPEQISAASAYARAD